jgi:hypothetical protein
MCSIFIYVTSYIKSFIFSYVTFSNFVCSYPGLIELQHCHAKSHLNVTVLKLCIVIFLIDIIYCFEIIILKFAITKVIKFIKVYNFNPMLYK